MHKAAQWFGRSVLFAATVMMAGSAAVAAEPLKIGLLLTVTSGPVFIAKEKGLFAAEGFDAEIVPFDAGQPVAVAAVSGAIDFGVAGVTSALYTLAGEGALKIVGGSTYDRPGFHAAGVLASSRAYGDGLTSLKSLGGHSVALTQIGSTYHYALAILAEKFGVDMKTIRAVPVQSFANVASAVSGGTVDAGVFTTTGAAPLLAQGSAKLLAWVGEEVPWQVSAAWTATKTANERGDTVVRFLRALRKGSEAYNAAFVQDGVRKDGPTAPEIVAIIRKYVKLSDEQVRDNAGYADPELRLDVKDVQRQIDWYRSQGMLKGEVTLDQVLDRRYVVALPGT